MKTYLYRCWDREGQLLYAGIAGDVNQRTAQHSKSKFWWSDVVRVTRVAFETRFEALWAEWAVISTCGPVYNRAVCPPPAPGAAELETPEPMEAASAPVPGELLRMEAQLAPDHLRHHPRDRMRDMVRDAHPSGIGVGKILKKLKVEGYPTTYQTVNTWLRADAESGVLIQPGGNRTPYFPGPKMGFPYPTRLG